MVIEMNPPPFRRSRIIDHTADCTVVAVAKVADVSYSVAEIELRRQGYRPGEGATMATTAAAVWALLNAKPEIVGRFYTLAAFAEQYKGRCIVFCYVDSTLHAMAVVGGIVYNRQGCEGAAVVEAGFSW